MMSSSVQYWEGAALGKHAAALAEHISSPAAFDVLTSDDLDEIADLINLPADAREKLHECLTAASRRSLPPPPDEAEAQALQDLRSAQTALEHAESNMAGAAKAISHRAMMERTRAALDAAEARALASIDAAEASLNGVLSNAVRRVWNGETASDPLSWQLCLADDTLRPSRRDLASSKIAASCARELRSLVDAHSDTSPSIKLAFSDAVVVESLGKVTVAPARTAPVLQLRAQDLLRILSYATPANPRRSAAFLGLLSAVCFKFHSQTVSIGRLSDDPLSIAAAAACAGVEDAPPSAVVAQAALAHSASSALTSAWWRTGVAALRINARRPVAAPGHFHFLFQLPIALACSCFAVAQRWHFRLHLRLRRTRSQRQGRWLRWRLKAREPHCRRLAQSRPGLAPHSDPLAATPSARRSAKGRRSAPRRRQLQSALQ